MISFARTDALPMTSAREDHLLISQSLQGCSSAFGRLISKYQRRLYGDLLGVVDRETAADLVQEAFLRAFRKLDRFRRQSAFYTWLYRIAYHAALEWRRKQRAALSGDWLDQCPASASFDPVRQAEIREEQELLCAAVAQLSANLRAVLLLREWEGCDYQTIGLTLALPPGTVRSRLYRARCQLIAAFERVAKAEA
jgi:RNA polymerase sigma-70 factor, ECF subfamily